MINRQIVFLSLVIIYNSYWSDSVEAERRILARGKLCEATIVKDIYCPNELTRIQTDIDLEDDESETFYPIIHFLTDKSEIFTKQLKIGLNPPMLVGKKFSVVYNPINPYDILNCF